MYICSTVNFVLNSTIIVTKYEVIIWIKQGVVQTI